MNVIDDPKNYHNTVELFFLLNAKIYLLNWMFNEWALSCSGYAEQWKIIVLIIE